MSKWIDITEKLTHGLPVIDRELLSDFIDEYGTRRYLRSTNSYRSKTIVCEPVLKFKERNIDYILNNSWEAILKDALHKVMTKYNFERSVEHMFFMEAVNLKIAAELAEQVKVHAREKVSLNDGSLHYKYIPTFGVPATMSYNVDLHIWRDTYHFMDDVKHPYLSARLQTYEPEYRNEFIPLTEEYYSHIDVVCLSENIRIRREIPPHRMLTGLGYEPAVMQSESIPYVDWRKSVATSVP